MNTSNTVGTFEAKTHLSELLERVSAGESFVITRRGQAIARLVPARPGAAPLAIEDILVGARALRAQVGASDSEIRAWIDEGRA
jgi:prevent-host-death family protein